MPCGCSTRAPGARARCRWPEGGTARVPSGAAHSRGRLGGDLAGTVAHFADARYALVDGQHGDLEKTHALGARLGDLLRVPVAIPPLLVGEDRHLEEVER